MKLFLKALTLATAFLTVKAGICEDLEKHLKKDDGFLLFLCDDNASSLALRAAGEKVLLRLKDFPKIDKFHSSLRSLELREIDINQKVVDLLCDFKKLQDLEIQECDYDKNLDWSCFKNLKELNQINIWDYSEYKMKQFPDSFYSLTSLKSLYLENQEVPSLSDKIKNLKNLEELYLKGNSIKEIPSGLCELTKLKELRLNSNSIKKLPSCINKLKSLEDLLLDYNNFTTIPKEIGDLKNLKFLDLSNNKLDCELPQFLNNLTNLKMIYLENNVNIKGKVLTNKSLENCYYYDEESDKPYDICKPKDVEIKCLEDNKKIKYCENDLPISTNDKCGKTDGRCPSGKCCSKYGYCGTTEKHCLVSKGCQSEFGKCSDDNNDLPISTNDKCGKTDGRCPSGRCCSKYGWCGTSDKHCLKSKGCQSEFGICKN